jgi:hypothetical protein
MSRRHIAKPSVAGLCHFLENFVIILLNCPPKILQKRGEVQLQFGTYFVNRQRTKTLKYLFIPQTVTK